jgi:hypothetical protein
MIGLLSLLPFFAAPIQDDPISFSFAFFGCNRIDKGDWDKATNPSTANLPQLRQNFLDILALNPRPKILFATGDLVLGYGNDKGEEVRSQLDAWIAEYRNSPLRGKIALIPMAGNHEVNTKNGDERVESLFTTPVWNDWVTKNHLMPIQPNGPTSGGPDDLVDDQSKLNFSFDSGGVHFICLNTDTRVKDGRIGYVPANWIREDLRKAGSMPTFILGHRNVVDGISAKGDAPIEPKSGGELIKDMQANPNVMGYLCAHVHAWDVTKIGGTAPWQIIAGNGGSKLEKAWKPEGGRTFGFAVIEIRKSGTVNLVPYFRPEKEHKVSPATRQPDIMLGKVSVP